MTKPVPKDTNFQDYKKKFQKDLWTLDTMTGKLCDLRKEAKCTLNSLPMSCTKMLAKVQLPKAALASIFGYCDLKAPCAQQCNGVTEKCYRLMDNEMWWHYA